MKIAYILFGNLNKKGAHIHHSLGFSVQLSAKESLVFFSSHISRSNLKKTFSFFSLPKNFKIISWPFFVSDNNFLLEKIGRLFSAISTWICLKFSRFDLIYTTDFSFIYFLSFLPKSWRPRAKICFESHKIYFKTSKKVSRRQEAQAYRVVDFFVSTSENCHNDLVKIFKIEKKHILILPNSVDFSSFDRAEPFDHQLVDAFWQNKNDLRVIYSGSFVYWKGIDVLIRSLERLDSNIKVLMFGGDRDDLAPFLPEIELQEKSGRLLLLDKMDKKNMTNLLLKAEVGVLSNNFDNNNLYTSPMKIPEYFSAGLLVVAPSILRGSGFFTGEESSLFFETENYQDLASKINFINKNKNIIKTSIGNKNIAKRFDNNVKMERLISYLYQQIKYAKN